MTDELSAFPVLYPDDCAWLSERGKRTGNRLACQIHQELSLWRAAMHGELQKVSLTMQQIEFLANLYAGTSLPPWLEKECYADAAGELAGNRDNDGEEWDINDVNLLNLLRNLSPVADYALRDALNRWWKLDRQEKEDTAESFAKVGIVIVGTGTKSDKSTARAAETEPLDSDPA